MMKASWIGPSPVMLLSRARFVLIVSTAMAVAGPIACNSSGEDTKTSQANAGQSDPFAGEIIEQKTELGPVAVRLRVAPKHPTLGDVITLDLNVTAQPHVTVEMPEFGEALGRFNIVKYVPRQTLKDGKWVGSQRYTLQAPMSGKQRIPPLRIEFNDNRPGREGASAGDPDQATPDQGSGNGSGGDTATAGGDTATAGGDTATAGGDTDDTRGVRELLTEEIPIEIASMLQEDLDAATLSDVRGRLQAPSTRTPLAQNPIFWLIVALVIGVGAYFGGRHWWAQRAKKRRISAYDAAMKRLSQLENKGLPKADIPGMVDNWYVELSGIVRRYLEDRYNLRAPELTTEEFLQVARGSGVLSTEHRKLLESFLRRCDSVKFARYAPEDEESNEALESARSFLNDTRPQAATQEHEEGT